MLAITTSATRPTPNHTSCRTAAPPVRPTFRFASVTGLVRTSAPAPPDRGRALAPLAAALDEHDDHHLGLPHGRERGEPRVVLPERGLRLRDHLGRAGLAGDVEAGGARAAAPAAG